MALELKQYSFVDYSTQVYSALVGVLILLFHNHTVSGWPWLVGAHAAGLLLVHWLIRLQAQYQQSKALDFLRHFYPVLLYTAFFCETGHLNRMFVPDFLDPMLIRCDQAVFGCQPGVILMQKLPWLALSEMLYAAYFSYYLMVAGVGLALFVRNREQFFHYVSVVSFVFYVCYLLYIALPVIGPQVMTGDAPDYSLPADMQGFARSDAYPAGIKNGPFYQMMAWIYRVFESPGAAIPSSHVAVALCTVFFSFRYLRPIRYVHLTLALLLCFSTLYCHFHYGMDVISGMLTAAILVPVGNRLYCKFGNRNSKSEIRNPKSEGTPKSEVRRAC